MYDLARVRVPSKRDIEAKAFDFYLERPWPRPSDKAEEDWGRAHTWAVNDVAYQLWENRGCHHGHDVEDHLLAERLVEQALFAHDLWWDEGGVYQGRNAEAPMVYFARAGVEMMRNVAAA